VPRYLADISAIMKKFIYMCNEKHYVDQFDNMIVPIEYEQYMNKW